jgi:hypothetical protein
VHDLPLFGISSIERRRPHPPIPLRVRIVTRVHRAPGWDGLEDGTWLAAWANRDSWGTAGFVHTLRPTGWGEARERLSFWYK